MSIVPVRNLSKYGIITDVDPYNLPPEAWSFGVNVRFHAGSIYRSPVFRSVHTLATASPRYVAADTPTSSFSSIILGYDNGSVAKYAAGTESDISIAAYTPANSEACFTSCHLADVFYINRSDRVPWSLRTTDTQFQALANWDATWRANILRSAGGALCAFGITKGGVSYPSMIKTSEFAIADTVPSTWDETLTTTNATENILAEMRSGITDAQNLGEIMIVYGLEETWAMIADGSEEVWSYHKLFDDKGCINANCSVEVNKTHYVFGLNDIWRHDGTSKESICEGRVRDFIFQSLNVSKANRCFVVYNKKLNSVYFCYPSADRGVGFTLNDGCNRAAVYNISEDTWTFEDLPYIYSAVEANVDTIATWATATQTWDTIGGSWADQEDSLKRVVVMVGDTDATFGLTKSLYAFDLQGEGSLVALDVTANATKGWQLERDGIDLDEVGADLKGYKLLSSIYPQARLEPGATAINFNVGAADYFNQLPIMAAAQTYDGAANYKLDYNMAGRYLKLNLDNGGDYHWMKISGLDLDLDVLGER